jgi:hypothetical protein
MSNHNDERTSFFEIVVYVSTSLKTQVTASLDLFTNTPNELTQHTVYGNGRRLNIVTINASFLNNTSSCVNRIPNIKSELAFIICDHSPTEIATADVIRSHRVKKKLGITFVDVIALESQGASRNHENNQLLKFPVGLTAVNKEIIAFKNHFSEGIRYWQAEDYDSLINTVKTSLYILGFYFQIPIACIDWADFLSALTSKGCGVIFQQGEDIAQLTKDCCRSAKKYGGSPVAIMFGSATFDDFNTNTFSKVMDSAYTHINTSDIFCSSVCYGPDAEVFLPFINPKLAWCWLSFRSDLPQDITPIGTNCCNV